jgi:hypothetical protein
MKLFLGQKELKDSMKNTYSSFLRRCFVQISLLLERLSNFNGRKYLTPIKNYMETI